MQTGFLISVNLGRGGKAALAVNLITAAQQVSCSYRKEAKNLNFQFPIVLVRQICILHFEELGGLEAQLLSRDQVGC